MKLMILNGPNINLLGQREPGIYGRENYETLCRMIMDKGRSLDVETEIRQTNSEGELVTYIQEAQQDCSGLIINPAAYTHYSIAVLDALQAVSVPAVEVHISHIYGREEFRHHSVTAPACIAQICGFGLRGYLLAMEGLTETLREAQSGNNK